MSGKGIAFRRMPAGALMLVVVVSTIVAAILTALLLLTSNRRLLMERDEMRQAVRRNLFSGLAYAQAHVDLAYLQPQPHDLFGEGRDSVTIEKKPWGVYDVAVVTAARSHFADTLVALLGSEFSMVNRAALYLAAENLPLSVNGDAQVRGEAYLPKAKPARDATLPLIGSHRTGPAVTSQLHPSRDTLPIDCDSALARLHSYASLQLQSQLPIRSRTTEVFHSLSTPFVGPADVLYRASSVNLAGLTLKGQIVVVSSRRLVVEASAQLENVVLVAPVVVVKPGFRGRLQIIARDTVDIQAGCELQYPSAACAYAEDGPTHIFLGENTRLSGVVIAAHPNRATTPCIVHMGPGAAVEGQLFSKGTIENCGSVRGSVMCRQLLYRTSSTFYDNYLVNAVLDRAGLPAAFLTSRLLNVGAPTGVIAWLR